jgi:glycosyltransferase involved in cell wall biosynthesis
MKRILLVGYNPPQLSGENKIEAAHYRTWQFLQPLLDDGHQICLSADQLTGNDNLASIPQEWSGQLQYKPVPYGHQGWRVQLQHIHDEYRPDCVVAVNFSHCLYASRLKTPKPIWMDIYGDMLTIMQAACFRTQSDRGLATSIAYMRQVLSAGDAFSVCSSPQKHLLVGELAMSGRLNRHTFGYEFAHLILPGSPAITNSNSTQLVDKDILSQHGIREDDFVVLWSGGYNTWTDIDTLVKGLEAAMNKDTRIHYVSVGDSTYQAPDNVYIHLQEKVARSPHRDRFHLLGWRPWSEMESYYRSSHLGLNIDAIHYETIYGTRTRLLEMLVAELPVITSLGTELSYLLESHGAALTFQVGDWKALAAGILALAGDESRRQEMRNLAKDYAQNGLSFYQTTAPLRDWVKDAQRAPDKVNLGSRERIRNWEFQGRAFIRQLIWGIAGFDK